MSLEFKFLFGPEITEAELQMPVEQRVAWPIDAIVMFAYDEGRLVGRMGLMSIKLIEGTWADESVRGTATPYRMMKQMEALIQYLGNTGIFAMAADEQPEVKGYLERVGYERLPVTLLVKSFVKESEVAA